MDPSSTIYPSVGIRWIKTKVRHWSEHHFFLHYGLDYGNQAVARKQLRRLGRDWIVMGCRAR